MENVSVTQMAIGAISAVALAGGIWYLSKDDDSVGFDSSKHTKEDLIKLLNELNLEFTCIYARAYNVLLKAKENGTSIDGLKNELRAQIARQIGGKTQQVLNSYEKEKYNENMLRDWIAYYANDAAVKKISDNNVKLEKDVFEHVKLESIEFQEKLPEKLTKEMYVQIYRKIYATIRHDLYIRIKDEQKKLKKMNLTEEIFSELYNETYKKFNDVRMDIMELMLDERFEKEDAKRFMQMAYVKFATESHYKDADGKPMRSRWADQITEIGHKDSKYIEEMAQGKFYEGIEKDPRDSKQPDEKIDLGGLPTYTSQKTTLDNERHVTPIDAKTEKNVNKFIQKFRERREEKKAEEAKKQEEQEQEKKEEIAAAVADANAQDTTTTPADEKKAEEKVKEEEEQAPLNEEEPKKEETVTETQPAEEDKKADVDVKEIEKKEETEEVKDGKQEQSKVPEAQKTEVVAPEEGSIQESKKEQTASQADAANTEQTN